MCSSETIWDAVPAAAVHESSARTEPVSTGCGIQSRVTRLPSTSASAHSTWAASARGQECTKTTPRVITRAPAGTARVPA